MEKVQLLRIGIALCALVFLAQISWGHITLRPEDPLKAGTRAARVQMIVPNERHVPMTKAVLEIPEDFRRAGGRLSNMEYPVGWEVKVEKESKPAEIYQQELEARSRRRAARDPSAMSEEERREEEIRSELLKQWITKVTFEGGSIPTDGTKGFLLTFQLPRQAGRYYLSAVQAFEDGTEVAWSERVEGEGAERPAPFLLVERPYDVRLAALLAAFLVLMGLLIQPLTRYRRWRQARPNAP